jgi:hypothetical protein
MDFVADFLVEKQLLGDKDAAIKTIVTYLKL